MNRPMTKERWLYSNDYGKELFVDEALAAIAQILTALEALADRCSGLADDEFQWGHIDTGDAISSIAQDARAALAEAKGGTA